jgi:hypothetical protein
MQTQYGDPTHRLEPDDLLRYLSWCGSLDAIERTAIGQCTGRSSTGHPPISPAPSGVAA